MIVVWIGFLMFCVAAAASGVLVSLIFLVATTRCLRRRDFVRGGFCLCIAVAVLGAATYLAAGSLASSPFASPPTIPAHDDNRER